LVTGDAAAAFGLRGRGLIRSGYAADVVIFDEHEVATAPVESRTDLPANGTRLYAEARGVDTVLVNGTVIVERAELTGEVPGTVLRSGRDTDTVAVA
jgi:N-acyl-D-aspartate/D-glutamate deacylase